MRSLIIILTLFVVAQTFADSPTSGTNAQKLILEINSAQTDIELIDLRSQKKPTWAFGTLKALTSGNGIDVTAGNAPQTVDASNGFNITTRGGKLYLTGLPAGKLVFQRHRWGFATQTDGRGLHLIMSTKDRYQRIRTFLFQIIPAYSSADKSIVGLKLSLVNYDRINADENRALSAAQMVITQFDINKVPIMKLNWHRPHAGGITADEFDGKIEFIKERLAEHGGMSSDANTNICTEGLSVTAPL